MSQTETFGAYRCEQTPPTKSPAAISPTPFTSMAINDLLLIDHREVLILYYKLHELAENPTSSSSSSSSSSSDGDKDDAEFRRWAGQLVWCVVRHSAAEEALVYPAMERSSGLAGMAAEARTAHVAVERGAGRVAELLRAGARRGEVLREVDAVMEKLIDHINMEETQDLVEWKSAMSSSDQEELGRLFAVVKKMQPQHGGRVELRHPLLPAVQRLVVAVRPALAELRKKVTEYPSAREVRELLRGDGGEAPLVAGRVAGEEDDLVLGPKDAGEEDEAPSGVKKESLSSNASSAVPSAATPSPASASAIQAPSVFSTSAAVVAAAKFSSRSEGLEATFIAYLTAKFCQLLPALARGPL
ncbi:hypothetical protein DFJ73DRAFT_776474 [Zopfochytrium polystomum]|nr:hypothetical protein DFJ73DRAFT_776474 [Zopfochytrium polystomum]